jgi:hypothetical protein
MTGEGTRLMVYTAVRAASPQKRSGQEAEMRRARTVSRMCLCLRSARPFF